MKRLQQDEQLFQLIRSLDTEKRNSRSSQIDTASVSQILEIINREDKKVAAAVGVELRHIERAVALVVGALRRGGRLIYVGAGTSGRLGILDAAECPPTFGTDPDQIRGLIAGGKKAVFKSQEGSEDRANEGAREVRRLRVSHRDVVCGIAASTRTPFVVSALAEAKRCGAKTILVTTNQRSKLRTKDFTELRNSLDVAICPAVGPEVIMGSTRMKSGTAQKMVLNMITTAAMIRLGKVYENMMIDLKMNSRKLEERAKRVLMIASGIDYQTAGKALAEAGGHVKTAIVMTMAEIGPVEARRRLGKARGFVRLAISQKPKRRKAK